MSIEDEIQEVEEIVSDVEEYVNLGIWDPDRQSQVAREIVGADKTLDQLKMGHTMKIDVLSEEQVQLVGVLLKRLGDVKDGLPSPPWSSRP